MELIVTIDNAAVARYNAHYKQLHPKSRKPAISKPIPPSMNEFMVMGRAQRNSEKQRWKEFVSWLVADLGLSNTQINRCRVELMYYFHDKRKRDYDNYSGKFVFDGLTASGLLVDDSYFVIESLTIRAEVDRSNPRLVIKLEDCMCNVQCFAAA